MISIRRIEANRLNTRGTEPVGWGIRKKRLPNGGYIKILPTKSERDRCMNRVRQIFENMNIAGVRGRVVRAKGRLHRRQGYTVQVNHGTS